MSDAFEQSDEHRTPRFYSVDEAAEILKVSKMTLYRSINDGTFPAIQIRGRKVIPAKAIDEMEANATDTPSVKDTSDWGK